MKKTLGLIAILIVSCHDNCDNNVNISLSFINKNDTLEISENNQIIFSESFRSDFSYLNDSKMYILKNYCYANESKIKIRINQNDTTFFQKWVDVKEVIIGRNIYNDILVDYKFKDGSSSIEATED